MLSRISKGEELYFREHWKEVRDKGTPCLELKIQEYKIFLNSEDKKRKELSFFKKIFTRRHPDEGEKRRLLKSCEIELNRRKNPIETIKIIERDKSLDLHAPLFAGSTQSNRLFFCYGTNKSDELEEIIHHYEKFTSSDKKLLRKRTK